MDRGRTEEGVEGFEKETRSEIRKGEKRKKERVYTKECVRVCVSIGGRGLLVQV